MSRLPTGRRFIGRENELALLDTLLERAAHGATCCALVSGPAGVGKSTLLSEFAERTGGRVLVGSCLRLGERGVPFAPISEIVRRLADDAEVGTLVPDGLAPLAAPSSAVGSESGSRTRLFQTLLALISQLAATATTTIVIEDLHWADRSTRDLLSFLIPNLRSERLLIVLSYRTDDVYRDHPLRPMLADLGRNPCVHQIPVEPFTAPLVADQVEGLTGRAPSPPKLAEIMRRTQGNPYFVEQIVAADRLGDRSLPASLRELLLVRADVVSAVTRRTLRVMAVAEDVVDDESLAMIAGVDVGELREHLREALDMRLIEATPNGVRFAHALLREALTEDLLPGERADHHAAFARAIAVRLDQVVGRDAGLLAQLAHHWEGAGNVTQAIGAWSDAATAAEDIFAFAEAHHHLSRIMANWHRVAAPDDMVGGMYTDLLERAAEDAFLGGDAEAASRLAREAITLVGDEPLIAGRLHERLARYVRDTAEHDEALDLVERALVLTPDDPPSADHARVLAGVAGQLMTHGRYHEARSFASSAVDEARRTGSTLAEADALNTLGVLATVIDDVETGLAMMRQALTLAERCGDAHQQMRAYWNLTACLSDAGEWERCLVAFREATVQLPRLGQGHLLPELYTNAADILLRLGRWDEAQHTVDEANLRFGSHSEAALLAELIIERGEFESARSLIESRAARNVFTDQEQQGWPLVHRATLETWEGRHESARVAVDSALAITADLDGPIATGYALAVGCRCDADAAVDARRRGNPDDLDLAVTRCETLVKQIDDLIARPGPTNGWKREVGALVAQCAAELTRATADPDPLAWEAATAAWDRMQMPYHAAYTRFRQAEAIVEQAGDRRLAERVLREAHAVATALGAAPLRGLIEGFARRARVDIGLARSTAGDHGLTAREREVLAALATGATNRQIASALFISEKTASVHVSNIIRKLDVSNRGEAAALAHRTGLVTTDGTPGATM